MVSNNKENISPESKKAASEVEQMKALRDDPAVRRAIAAIVRTMGPGDEEWGLTPDSVVTALDIEETRVVLNNSLKKSGQAGELPLNKAIRTPGELLVLTAINHPEELAGPLKTILGKAAPSLKALKTELRHMDITAGDADIPPEDGIPFETPSRFQELVQLTNKSVDEALLTPVNTPGAAGRKPGRHTPP